MNLDSLQFKEDFDGYDCMLELDLFPNKTFETEKPYTYNDNIFKYSFLGEKDERFVEILVSIYDLNGKFVANCYVDVERKYLKNGI